MCTSSGGLFSFLKAGPDPGAYAWILKWNKIKVGSLHTMSMWKLEFFSMLQGSVFKFMSIDWSGVRKRWYFGLKYLFLLTQTQLGSVSISRSCMLTKCWNTELNRRLLAEMSLGFARDLLGIFSGSCCWCWRSTCSIWGCFLGFTCTFFCWGSLSWCCRLFWREKDGVTIVSWLVRQPYILVTALGDNHQR